MSDADEFIQGELVPFYKRAFDAFKQNHHAIYSVLDSFLSTPVGIIRPYIILEKSTLERMIQDEPNFIKDPFATKIKYHRDMTIKFL